MSSIDFEQDQRQDLNSVNDAKSLSDQVMKLKSLEDELEEKEKELKELKRNIDLVSGEVIPTMMQEMNGLGDLIKNEITVSFGRNEDNKAQQYAVLAQGQGFDPVQKLKVEPMTLKALVRERLESGQEIPSDLFNVFSGNRTKVTRSK